MKSLRKLVSSAVLTLGVFGLLSSAASAQTARGTFTLTHEVHWKNAVVPAGTYHFSLESKGPSELLTLHNLHFYLDLMTQKRKLHDSCE